MDEFPNCEVDSVGYDPTTGEVYTTHDWETDSSLCRTIIWAIAAVSGQSPEELPPLYSAIDPGALENVFQPRSEGKPRTHGRVSFTYNGFDIDVFASGRIRIDVSELDAETIQSRSRS
nr:HalOD1 output domain-containing protein [Natrarchaeobius chitinivorans]